MIVTSLAPLNLVLLNYCCVYGVNRPKKLICLHTQFHSSLLIQMCLQRGGTISNRCLLPLPVSIEIMFYCVSGSSLMFPFNDKLKGVGIEVLSKIRAKGQTSTEKLRGNHAWSTEHYFRTSLQPPFARQV